MKEITLNLSNLQQDVPDAENRWADRLMGSLEKRNGIKRVRFDTAETLDPQLCISFDEELISANQIQHIVTKTADKLDDTFGHLWIKLQQVRDKNRTQAVTALLKNLKGVMRVSVVPTGWIFLEFNNYITRKATLIGLIEKMGLVI